ncbi:hypothetical protein BH683_006450 [Williamsia sp. 1138]|uniref:TM2 domain-containing protein n=1 Tax=Williamsia sp. 1138 TaxID=1903117 RepID=UPI000A0FE5EB|nr:TM2 domain-containing protein [Williamsia sp. 1138]OZG30019.1 hypothetical protein BH683_006450 [Williamsia sp. 1138]
MSYPGPYENSGTPEWQSSQPPQGSPGYPAPYEAPMPIYPAPAPYGQPAYGPAAFGPVAGFSGDPGAPFGRDPYSGEPLSDKSKVVAGLLQLFLGGFGAGRFYIGSNGIAIGQLCALIAGWVLAIVLIGYIILLGLGIWVIVDAIMIFTGSVRDSRGLKLRD